MQQRFESTSLARQNSQILEITKIFILHMQKLQISAVNIMNSTIKTTLMNELLRTNSQTVSIRTESNTIVNLENLGQMIALSSVREIMSQQSMYFTLWEIVTDVMPANTDSKVFVNVNTLNLSWYFLYSEAVFKKHVMKQWLSNIQLTNVMMRENAILRLWTDIVWVDYMMKVMINSESWNTIDYVHLIYKENNSQSQLRKEEWQIKSRFFNIVNKEQENIMLRQIAQTDEMTTCD